MRIIRIVAQRTKAILTGLAAYITITGLITFSMFIMEESIQMVMFGTWQAKDNYYLLYKGVRVVEQINLNLKMVNKWGGWINPFARLSYGLFADSTDFWIQSNLQKILASEPDILAGRQIRIEFQPIQVERNENGYIGRAGKISLKAQTEPRGDFLVTVVKGGELVAQ